MTDGPIHVCGGSFGNGHGFSGCLYSCFLSSVLLMAALATTSLSFRRSCFQALLPLFSGAGLSYQGSLIRKRPRDSINTGWIYAKTSEYIPNTF